MQEPIVESHPFAALLPPQATVMMMGTFPPKEEKTRDAVSLSEFSKRYVACVRAGVFRRCGAFSKSRAKKAFDADKIKAFFK